MNVFSLAKTVDAPLDFVYEWCTDFRPEHIGLPRESRRMLEVTERRAIYIEIYRGPEGDERMGVDVITLRPPRSWRMDYFGQDNDEVGIYSLKRVNDNRTRIEMRFRNRWKGAMSLTTDVKRRIESDAWDGYISSLERDYSASRSKHGS